MKQVDETGEYHDSIMLNEGTQTQKDRYGISCLISEY